MVAMNMSDISAGVDWSRGHYDTKVVLWVIYNFFNLVGVSLGITLIVGISLLPSLSSSTISVGKSAVIGRTSSDIFIVSLCVGCLIFSLPCAVQCLMNMVHGRFAYGHIACDVEAFFHVSGILHQFLSLMVGGFRNYLSVVKNYVIAERVAIIICCGLCVLSVTGTVIVGRFSDVYLMPSGTYCLYRFNSPVIYGWFLPVCVLCLISLIVFYGRIFYSAKAVLLPTRSFHVKPMPGRMLEYKSNDIMMAAAAATTPNTKYIVGNSPASVGGKIAVKSAITSNDGVGPNPNSAFARATSPAPSPSSQVALFNNGRSSPLLIPVGGDRAFSPSMAPPAGGVSARRGIRTAPSIRAPGMNVDGTAGHIQSSLATTTGTNGETIAMRVAQRSVMFVAIFFLGWIFAIASCIYELSTDELPQWLDSTAAAFGCAHTLAVPIAYGWTNRRIRVALTQKWSCLSRCCLFGEEQKPIVSQHVNESSHRILLPPPTANTAGVRPRSSSPMPPVPTPTTPICEMAMAEISVTRSSYQRLPILVARVSAADSIRPASTQSNGVHASVPTVDGSASNQHVTIGDGSDGVVQLSAYTPNISLPKGIALPLSPISPGGSGDTESDGHTRSIRSLSTPGLTITTNGNSLPLPST